MYHTSHCINISGTAFLSNTLCAVVFLKAVRISFKHGCAAAAEMSCQTINCVLKVVFNVID